MSILVVDNFHYQDAPIGTSADGALRRWARDIVICVSGKLSVQGTTSTESQIFCEGEMTAAEQTNSGLAAIDETVEETSAAIAELRRRSGLTWDQLAKLFAVTRRSVHFWASGKLMNVANAERLSRLLTVARYIDRGSAQATRAAIMTALPDGCIPFDLLAKGDLDEVTNRLGAGSLSAMSMLAPLSVAVKSVRMPPSPNECVGALQDTVHHEVGRSRTVQVLRTQSK